MTIPDEAQQLATAAICNGWLKCNYKILSSQLRLPAEARGPALAGRFGYGGQIRFQKPATANSQTLWRISMDEFSTYIFKENEVKTNNKRVNKERPYYIGILIFLFSVLLYLLDFDYAIHFFVAGYIVLVIGQITMFGRVPSVGHRPVTLKLTKGSIYIGKERLEIKSKEDVDIRIVGYQGQGIYQRTAFYQAHSGNDNLMRIRYGDKVTEFKFILESEIHKDKLVNFCKEHGFVI